MRALKAGLAAVAVAAATVAGGSVAHAATCYDASYNQYQCPDPTITGLTAPSTVVRGSDAVIGIPVKVTVDDPSGIVDAVDITVTHGSEQVTGDFLTTPTSRSGSTLVFTTTLSQYPFDPYGTYTVTAEATGSEFSVRQVRSATTTVKTRSVATNTPSATTVRKGQAFTERGYLRGWDGSALPGQRVNIYYVPAGQTRSSYAGYATTSSTGSFSLTVHAYYTGSWFVSYPGSSTATSTYKGAWVRVA